MKIEKSDTLSKLISKFFFRRAHAIQSGKIDDVEERIRMLRIQRDFLDSDIKRFQRPNKSVRDAFHPSQLGGCPIKSILRFFGVRPTIVGSWEEIARGERIFSMGDAVHLRYQTLFRRMKILIARELRLDNPDFPGKGLQGTLDALIRLDGRPVVVELKSAGGWSMSQVSRGKLPQGYLVQCVLYIKTLEVCWKKSRALRKISSTPPSKAILFFEGKDRQDLQEFHITEVDENYDRIQSYAKEISDFVESRELPKRPYDDSTKFPCSFCEFSEVCYTKRKMKECQKRHEFSLVKTTAPKLDLSYHF